MIVRRLGLVEYEPTWRRMQEFTAARDANCEDEIWLLEHPPVFTLGQAGKREHLLHDTGIPLVKVDRGGQITYHGPGQLVVYLLLDLRRRDIKIRELVHKIEQALINTLSEYGISAQRLSGAPGVYVDDAKIAALGLRVKNGCTFHGLALNVDMDLSPYRAINPCGYAGLAVTQIKNYCATADLTVIGDRLVKHLEAQMETQPKMGSKQTGAAKTSRIPIKIVPLEKALPKPSWIRVKAGNSASRFGEVKQILREHQLHTVCEEATCPNIGECFGNGTATFMILGDLCTRRCPFCDVGHGKPLPPDAEEPNKLAATIAAMRLKYVVITSVDRDDLRDGGAQHFVDCIAEIRRQSPQTKIEVLVPDFRGRLDVALKIFDTALPDVMNHNLETVPRLYKQARPGADYAHSLQLLKAFKARHSQVPTKSGLMVGLGETDEEILETMRDMRAHDIEMLTIGQYLAPSRHHLPVLRYVHPDTFAMYEREALAMGFTGAACAPLVRSSYHADQQAQAAGKSKTPAV